jgi:hypothetical protein
MASDIQHSNLSSIGSQPGRVRIKSGKGQKLGGRFLPTPKYDGKEWTVYSLAKKKINIF